MKKLKELYFLWGFLDINNTCHYQQTYFKQFEDQNCMENQEMISRFSLLLSFVSFYVTLFLTKNFPTSSKYIFHLMMMILLFIFLYVSKLMTFQYVPASVSHTMTILFISFLYIIVIANQLFSFELPSAMFYVLMSLVPIAFTLPPLVTLLINLFWAAIYAVIVHQQKPTLAFYEDVLALTIVLVISSMMGYFIGRTRAEQAFANERNNTLAKTLQQASITDQLTGLMNHRSFQSDYYELYDGCQQNKRHLGVIMLDIDKFKLFNDYYGHLEGDRCLSQIGHTIGSFTSQEISTYRFGGEEFVLLLRGTAASRTIAIAEKVRQKVYDLQITHEYSPAAPVVTVSIGVHVGFPPKHEKPMNFFDHADQAMYDSKHAGGNKVSVYKGAVLVEEKDEADSQESGA
ncbi:MAG: GGDEF domain-containing protein [Clostridia bacterium]|nr:GGDEF domain-containing protein [Clostridia bacterium]